MVMSRYYQETLPTGYYTRKNKNDKYEGLFSKKQLADLEGETELPRREKVAKGEIARRVREQKKNAVGATFADKFDFSDYN